MRLACRRCRPSFVPGTELVDEGHVYEGDDQPYTVTCGLYMLLTHLSNES